MIARLTCPIGGKEVRDKRPAVIAALTAAELLMTLLAPKRSQGLRERDASGASNTRALSDA